MAETVDWCDDEGVPSTDLCVKSQHRVSHRSAGIFKVIDRDDPIIVAGEVVPGDTNA